MGHIFLSKALHLDVIIIQICTNIAIVQISLLYVVKTFDYTSQVAVPAFFRFPVRLVFGATHWHVCRSILPVLSLVSLSDGPFPPPSYSVLVSFPPPIPVCHLIVLSPPLDGGAESPQNGHVAAPSAWKTKHLHAKTHTPKVNSIYSTLYDMRV